MAREQGEAAAAPAPQCRAVDSPTPSPVRVRRRWWRERAPSSQVAQRQHLAWPVFPYSSPRVWLLRQAARHLHSNTQHTQHRRCSPEATDLSIDFTDSAGPRGRARRVARVARVARVFGASTAMAPCGTHTAAPPHEPTTNHQLLHPAARCRCAPEISRDRPLSALTPPRAAPRAPVSWRRADDEQSVPDNAARAHRFSSRPWPDSPSATWSTPPTPSRT